MLAHVGPPRERWKTNGLGSRASVPQPATKLASLGGVSSTGLGEEMHTEVAEPTQQQAKEVQGGPSAVGRQPAPPASECARYAATVALMVSVRLGQWWRLPGSPGVINSLLSAIGVRGTQPP